MSIPSVLQTSHLPSFAPGAIAQPPVAAGQAAAAAPLPQVRGKICQGKPDFAHTPPTVRIPEFLNISPAQKAAIEQACLQSYRETQTFFDESIADAIAQVPQVKAFVDERAARLYTIIEIYAKITHEELNHVLETVLFNKENKQIVNYRGNIGGKSQDLKYAFFFGNFHMKMFLIGEAAKTILKMVYKNEGMIQKINHELADKELAWRLKDDAPFRDTFEKPGIYAELGSSQRYLVNHEKVRGHDRFNALGIPDAQKKFKAANNPTIAQAKVGRIPIHPMEMCYTLHKGKLTEDELLEQGTWDELKKEYRPTAQDLKTQVDWDAGEAAFIPVTYKDNPDSEYLKVAHDLARTLKTGISNSASQKTSCLMALGGLESNQEMTLATMTCLLDFIDSRSHSSIEVIAALKGFGLNFHFAADDYLQIDPNGHTDFLKLLPKAHAERAQKMNRKDLTLLLPAHYLSEFHVLEVAEKMGINR